MPQMRCPQCGYSVVMTDKQAEIGMLCPECYCRNLKPVRKKKASGPKLVTFRPISVRATIGGILLLIAGFALLLFGTTNWERGRVGARAVGAGIVLMISGGISLITGVVNMLKDLWED